MKTATTAPQMHIMLDIETFDVIDTAVIASIGYTSFDAGLKNYHTIMDSVWKIDIVGQKGRTIDVKTVKWWMEQPDGPRQAVVRGKNKLTATLQEFVQDLHMFRKEYGDYIIWSKGSDFDLSIVENALKMCEIECPWSFRERGCFRTAMLLNPHIDISDIVNHDPHDPAADADHQARILHRYLLELSEFKEWYKAKLK